MPQSRSGLGVIVTHEPRSSSHARVWKRDGCVWRLHEGQPCANGALRGWCTLRAKSVNRDVDMNRERESARARGRSSDSHFLGQRARPVPKDTRNAPQETDLRVVPRSFSRHGVLAGGRVGVWGVKESRERIDVSIVFLFISGQNRTEQT